MLCRALPWPSRVLYLHLPWYQVCLQPPSSSFPCYSLLSPKDLPLPALCPYFHSLIFSKVSPTLVCKVIPLFPFFQIPPCLPGSFPSSETPCSFHIQPIIHANIPPSLMLPSHHAFFHTLPPFFTSLSRVVPIGAWSIPGSPGAVWRWCSEVMSLQRKATKHPEVLGALWPFTVRQEWLLPRAFGLPLPYGNGRWCWSGS